MGLENIETKPPAGAVDTLGQLKESMSRHRNRQDATSSDQHGSQSKASGAPVDLGTLVERVKSLRSSSTEFIEAELLAANRESLLGTIKVQIDEEQRFAELTGKALPAELVVDLEIEGLKNGALIELRAKINAAREVIEILGRQGIQSRLETDPLTASMEDTGSAKIIVKVPEEK